MVLANPAEIVTVGAHRDRGTGHRRLISAGHQATPRKGSASCMSKGFVALAAMKSCRADETSASVLAVRRPVRRRRRKSHPAATPRRD